jgi:hypothetical protein
MLSKKVDTKYKKHIGDYLLEYDHYSGLIRIEYKGDLIKAYEAKVHEADDKFDSLKERLQRVVEKQTN